MPQFWKGVLAFVNTWTDDHRTIGELSWRDLPLTLRFVREDVGGHDNAIPAGTIDRVWMDGDTMRAEGTFSDSADGQYAASVVADGSLRGISIDPGAVTARDIVIAADGQQIDMEEWMQYPSGEEPWPAPFEFGTVYETYEMGAATLVAVPAFAGASIEPSDTAPQLVAPPAVETPTVPATARVDALSDAAMVLRPATSVTKLSIGDDRSRLLASAAFRPPVDAFRPHDFGGYRPFSIDPDTRQISGYIYPWEGAHRGFGATYVRPPQSRDFTEFLSGGTVTADDGSTFHVGVITYKGGHCSTAEQYERVREDPANQLGPVVLYADEFGVQACGVAWPDLDPVELARAAAAYPSGDWQMKRGEQKLTGCALVNNPGYHAFEQQGVEVVRLVASFAGSKPTSRSVPTLTPSGLAGLAALDEWSRLSRS